MREICQYCSKTSHASEDCPIKLAAEEGYGSEDAEISGSENEMHGPQDEAVPEAASEPEPVRQLPASAKRQVPSRDNSYSPEVQVNNIRY